MVNLIAAAAFFLAIHVLVSGTRLRDGIVARIGDGPYLGLFALASVAGLTWFIFAYGQARDGGANPFWWGPNEATKGLQLILQLVAVVFVVVGLITPNPTSVKQEKVADRPDAVRGMLRITRHPFLWGVALWGLGHLLVNGDGASLLLFGTMAFLGATGGLYIDGKRQRALGDGYTAFRSQTSNLPFAAVVAGRQKLGAGLAEIGWRWLVALAVFALLLWIHPAAFGVSPLPGR